MGFVKIDPKWRCEELRGVIATLQSLAFLFNSYTGQSRIEAPNHRRHFIGVRIRKTIAASSSLPHSGPEVESLVGGVKTQSKISHVEGRAQKRMFAVV
ncbi:hypothetical protein TNCV_1541541 [Trichonephila clavipes]|nr:hypothetical protein TNCV_1541541 [Trichonephila clavipes]